MWTDSSVSSPYSKGSAPRSKWLGENVTPAGDSGASSTCSTGSPNRSWSVNRSSRTAAPGSPKIVQ